VGGGVRGGGGGGVLGGGVRWDMMEPCIPRQYLLLTGCPLPPPGVSPLRGKSCSQNNNMEKVWGLRNRGGNPLMLGNQCVGNSYIKPKNTFGIIL